MLSLTMIGFLTGVNPANSDFNISDNPQFIDDFIFTIWFKPSVVI